MEITSTFNKQLAKFNNPYIPKGFMAIDSTINASIDSNSKWGNGKENPPRMG